MRRRVADHRITSARKILLGFLRYLAGQTRKNEVAIERRDRRFHDDALYEFRHLAGQTPGARLRIRLALRSIGSRQRCDFKLRMVFQQLNEALADDASGS